MGEALKITAIVLLGGFAGLMALSLVTHVIATSVTEAILRALEKHGR